MRMTSIQRNPRGGGSAEMMDRRVLLTMGAAATTGVLIFGRAGQATPTLHFAVGHSPAEWRHILGPERYAVLREASTERPFSSALLNEHRKGLFVCGGCALPLFSSATKFDSGTGWPSFYRPLPRALLTRPDHSFMMERAEVLCRRLRGHGRHSFKDAPE